MNRRAALSNLVAGTAATAALSVGISQAAGADAELIALCRQFDANERRYLSLYSDDIPIEDEAARDEVAAPIQDQQSDLAERITSYRITTLAGFAAVARSLGLWDSTVGEPSDHSGVNEKLVAMLVRDARWLA
ncbi:MAG: hypothetical protein HIU90_17120 [Proteobacteria bacterium]|nr:hypothetical protein [Pseudomonadota bacterium]